MATLNELMKRLEREEAPKIKIMWVIPPDLAGRFQVLMDRTNVKANDLMRVAVEDLCEKYEV